MKEAGTSGEGRVKEEAGTTGAEQGMEKADTSGDGIYYGEESLPDSSCSNLAVNEGFVAFLVGVCIRTCPDQKILAVLINTTLGNSKVNGEKRRFNEKNCIGKDFKEYLLNKCSSD